MIISSSILILSIIVIRSLFLYTLPKKFFMCLWIVALSRLLIPVSLPSEFSILNMFGTSITHEITPISGIQPLASSFSSVQNTVLHMPWMIILWLVGMSILVVFFTLSYCRQIKKFKKAVLAQDAFIETWLSKQKSTGNIQIMISSSLDAPLSYGIIHPTILLPEYMIKGDQDRLLYILTHEYMHIRHFDLLLKILLTSILCVYWFHPLVWVMYFLINRDIELSCDESVIQRLGNKAQYAKMLISMARCRSTAPALFANFGKHYMKERIKSIMKLRKSSIFIIVLSVAILAVFTTAFASNQVEPQMNIGLTSNRVSMEQSAALMEEAAATQPVQTTEPEQNENVIAAPSPRPESSNAIAAPSAQPESKAVAAPSARPEATPKVVAAPSARPDSSNMIPVPLPSPQPNPVSAK